MRSAERGKIAQLRKTFYFIFPMMVAELFKFCYEKKKCIFAWVSSFSLKIIGTAQTQNKLKEGILK